MRIVSQAYKEAIQLYRTEGVRRSAYAEAYFGLIDYTAKPDSTLTASPQTGYSNAANMYNESQTITRSYATWEQDFFRLDGVQRLLPDSGYAAQGFVSSAVSGADGRFAESPYIDISFSQTHSVIGLTLIFDAISQQCPLDFTVRAWRDGSLIETNNIADNTDMEFREELSLDDFDRIRIDFTRTKPFQRVRLNGLTFGIGYTYGGVDLISLTHKRSAHPLSLSIPEAELRVVLYNEDGKFKVDADSSIIRFLMEGQQITLRYGIEIDDDKNIEWFRGGIFDLQSWSTEGYQATFIARDVFAELSNTTYRKGTYSVANPKSAGQLAAEVLQDAGLNHFEVANEIAYSALPLPIASHAECLQYVANMSSSILEQVDSGAVVMRTTREVSPDEWIIKKTPDSTPELPYSNVANVTEGIRTVTYATWEQDFFALDGSMRLVPDDGGYLVSGAVYDAFPSTGQYSTAGILVDFTIPFSFGTVEVGFGRYSAISRFRVVGIRNGGVTYQRDFNVTSTTTTVEDYFTNIRYLYIYPLENPKQQRIRIDYLAVSVMVWPKLTGDDVLGNAKDELMPAARDIAIRYWPSHNLIASPQPEQIVELMRTKVMPGELTEIQHSAAYYHISVSSDNPNVVFDVAEHYAYVSYVQVSGASEEVEIVFLGVLDEKLNSEYLRQRMSDRGTDVIVENPLSNDLNRGVRDQLEWFANYYSSRFQYEVETLGYPEVDYADEMEWEGHRAIVLENLITFNGGAMRGTMKFRRR